ncbi:MAG: CTP synthase, partial [Caldisericaceae bacterium]|nr:CTP synthase [Caldisericaceae bacterium]
MKKYIFVTGGVMSSLGKGISSASLGRILKSEGYKVTILKFDPYLNIDAGSQNPFQHGEVFVTEDGAETDLDLGHYERFLDEDLFQENNVTSGQVYQTVIQKERRGDYLGSTVQIIPHITEEIKKRIRILSENSDKDIIIVEVGGTVGDIESLPFLESIREFKMEEGEGNVAFVHLTYIPYLKTTGELKTKPTQHSVGELRKIGIQPDIIIARGEKDIGKEEKRKIALFTNVREENIFSLSNADLIYKVPLILERENIGCTLSRILHLRDRESKLSDWEE